MSNLDKQIEKLRKGDLLEEEEIHTICKKAKEILIEESNILRIDTPVTVCGDIHGQFFDMLELFKVGGDIPRTSYLFLGDYVDRGYNSIETFMLLLALKVRYPDRITLLRGNHESRQITQIYGFYDECRRKYGSSNVWRYCTDVFDFLTLAAIIDNTIFCIHGGLSPSAMKIMEIRYIDRRQEVPHEGAMCDLLWSDPAEDIKGWHISLRGAGYLFGEDIVAKFNHENKMQMIVRSHQLVMEGYKLIFNDKLSTVWSAPNYCYRCGNIAAILEIDSNLNKTYKIFEAYEREDRQLNKTNNMPEYFL